MLSYLDRTGTPVSFAQWQARNLHPGYSSLRCTERDGVQVSTIWLGVTRLGDAADSPSIFESETSDGEVRYYADEDAALAGHQEMCERVFGDDIPQDVPVAVYEQLSAAEEPLTVGDEDPSTGDVEPEGLKPEEGSESEVGGEHQDGVQTAVAEGETVALTTIELGLHEQFSADDVNSEHVAAAS